MEVTILVFLASLVVLAFFVVRLRDDFHSTGAVELLLSVRFRLFEFYPVSHSAIFKAMSDGVVVLSANGHIIDINPAARRMFGHAGMGIPSQPVTKDSMVKDAFIGHALGEFLPQTSPMSGCPDQESSGEICIHLEACNSQRIYKLTSTPLINRGEKVTGQVLIFTDITALKQAEEQLQQAHQGAIESNRMKTQLLANVSHDMRSPLGAIIGFADMLSDGRFGPLPEDMQMPVTEIQDSATQLLLFVNNLVSQAQLETGKILVRPRQFDAQELLDSCKPAVNLSAHIKNLEVDYEVDPTLPRILTGDLYWLRQITANLINNAVKFTEKGRVKLRLYRPTEKDWAIEVSDTGIGISPEMQSAIFEPFVQDQNAPRQLGSGLGLAIVKGLATLMNGQVKVASQPGHGSTFTVCLPLRVGEIAP